MFPRRRSAAKQRLRSVRREAAATPAAPDRRQERMLAARRSRLPSRSSSLAPNRPRRRGCSCEHGETSQGGACSSVTAEAAEFHAFPPPRPLECIPQRNPERLGVRRKSEIRPVDVTVGPRRAPTLVEVQTSRHPSKVRYPTTTCPGVSSPSGRHGCSSTWLWAPRSVEYVWSSTRASSGSSAPRECRARAEPPSGDALRMPGGRWGSGAPIDQASTRWTRPSPDRRRSSG